MIMININSKKAERGLCCTAQPDPPSIRRPLVLCDISERTELSCLRGPHDQVQHCLREDTAARILQALLETATPMLAVRCRQWGALLRRTRCPARLFGMLQETRQAS